MRSGPAESSLPRQKAEDMTAPETFTTASKRSLTKGRRPHDQATSRSRLTETSGSVAKKARDLDASDGA